MAAKVLKGEKKASEMNFEIIEEAAFYGNNKVAENLGITIPAELYTTTRQHCSTEIITRLEGIHKRIHALRNRRKHHVLSLLASWKKV